MLFLCFLVRNFFLSFFAAKRKKKLFFYLVWGRTWLVILHGGNGISLIEPIRLSSCTDLSGQSVYVMGSKGTKPSRSYKGKCCACVRRKTFWRVTVTHLNNSRGVEATLLWYSRKLLDLGLYCSKGYFFFHGCFNKSQISMTPVARGTPHHLVKMGRLLPACLLWEEPRASTLERLPKLWMALGVTNG